MPDRIVVTRALIDEALQPLHALGDVEVSPLDRTFTPAELRDAVRGATAVVCTLSDVIDADVVAAAGPGLRVVANTAVGYNNIDVAALAAAGVAVTNTPGVLVDATADLTLALLLDVTRRVSEGDRLIRQGRGWHWDFSFMLGAGLQGRRLGIVGMGAIGQAVARRAAVFGMEVVHHSRRLDVVPGSTRLELEELLETSDVVSLHCPLTPETRHLIDAKALSRMGSESFLVNTARGPVVDESALVEALTAGRLAGAALDVYEDEPAVHPGLLGLENVVLCPHLGSATLETRTRMAQLAVANVVAVLSGQPALNPVVG